jgi:hypothetical protein
LYIENIWPGQYGIPKYDQKLIRLNVIVWTF